MATIRFIREGLDVQCNPGENLRELVMKENLQLYGLKGILGNCGGAGQCSTCFISVEGGNKNLFIFPLYFKLYVYSLNT